MALLAALLLLVALPGAPARADAADAVTCRDVLTPISVPGAAPGSIYGRYCHTAPANGNPLQILVPGVTYTHLYWDLPGFDGRYSYAGFMNRHGYDTLAIDRLGIGRSTRPTLAMYVAPIPMPTPSTSLWTRCARTAWPGGTTRRSCSPVIPTAR